MAQRPDDNADLEELFARREQIDRALTDKLAREMAVMFTDIVGSTEYFERKGDLEGMALLKRHNDLLFPVVKRNNGRIVKTIGDAIMAVYEHPPDAARCALEMQRVLDDYRRSQASDPLRIKIGIHAGKVLNHEGDVFGDTVNTAARIASKAKGDEILVSESYFRSLPSDEAFAALPRGSLELRGKSERVPVSALQWREGATPDEEFEVFEPTPVPAAAAGGSSPELFVLELQLGAKGLKVTALDGASDKGTVKAYEELPIGREALDAIAGRFGTFMHAGGADSYRARIREQGVALFEQGLSERARRRLLETRLQHLRLHVDDELVQVPWELMHDGREFLCLRFAVGRIVAARARTAPEYRLPAPGERGGHALVVANPSGDLSSAAQEGKAVAGLLSEGFAGEVRLLQGKLRRADFLAALKGARILHFAGHARRSSESGQAGFRLADGIATPEEIADAVGRRAPDLVFANSCHSSTGGGWSEDARQLSNVASAFLLRGTQHYLGPVWDMPDADGLAFALRFYERALAGVPFGESVRAARGALASGPAQPLSFAGYVLYGEPRVGLPSAVVRLEAGAATRSAADVVAIAAGASRAAGWGGKFLRLSVIGTVLAGGAEIANLGMQYVQVRQTIAPAAAGTGGAAPVDAHAAPAGTQVAMVPRGKRSGPVRVAVLPFKSMSGDESVELGAALAEAIMTDFGKVDGVELIERQQLGRTEAEIKEAGLSTSDAYDDYRKLKWAVDFDSSRWVDPATRSALGKFKGAEVVVMGGYQRVGDRLRANARLVDVETGEILESVRVENAEGDVFALQDDLSARIPEAVLRVKGTLRP